MSNSNKPKIAIIGGAALAGLAIFVFTPHSDDARHKTGLKLEGVPIHNSVAEQKTLNAVSSASRGVAPFIVSDTATDSPGTNLETRVVTFTAEISGMPPVFQQWKVDKGGGFVAVSPSTTNSTLIISNAHLTDTGRYALFATNSVGSIRTTPMPLVVVEGLD